MESTAKVIGVLGMVITFLGLWYSATGLRVVVSGRIDERRRSANSLKWGLPMVVLGVLLWIGSTWLTNWAEVP